MGRRIPNYGEVEKAMESDKPEEPIQETPIPPSEGSDSQQSAWRSPSGDPATLYLYNFLQQHNANQRQNEIREQNRDAIDRKRVRIEARTFWVGIVGILGLLWTLSESQESNRISREALTSVQRAYVSLKTIDSVGVRDTQGKVASWQFFPQWENSGTTPTRTLHQHANSKWPEEPLPQDFDFHDAGEKDNRPYVLGSKGTISTGPLVISPEVMTEVRDGKKHLYFWGWAAYRDVFKDSDLHLTEFCNELIINGGDITTGEGVKFLHTACKSHNCTDEECADYKDTRKKLENIK